MKNKFYRRRKKYALCGGQSAILQKMGFPKEMQKIEKKHKKSCSDFFYNQIIRGVRRAGPDAMGTGGAALTRSDRRKYV